MSKRFVIVIATMVTALIVPACGDDNGDNGGDNQSAPAPAPEEAPIDAEMDAHMRENFGGAFGGEPTSWYSAIESIDATEPLTFVNTVMFAENPDSASTARTICGAVKSSQLTAEVRVYSREQDVLAEC